MGTKVWSAACAAIFLPIAAPVLAYESEPGCPDLQGPVFGNPDPGLDTFELVSDGESNTGV